MGYSLAVPSKPKQYQERKKKGEEMRKHLSPVANDVIHRCAQTLGTSVDALVEKFEMSFKPIGDNYSTRLMEFCSLKALENVCPHLGEDITDGSFSRFTFDMMLAWESPSATNEESYSEGVAKGKEDRKEPLQGNAGQMHDDISLFYSDIMPLLVNEEQNVGEDAYVWLSSSIPLVGDVVNARFTFETLTAPTASRLHFPAYDKFLKEMYKCIRYLQKQTAPTGYELAEDEFILHVEGTARTQRVVRHIGATNWPGRLTLTNQALYFEASGVISYENAVRVDLSKTDVDQQVEAASTGPWGAPLYDKAIVYKSPQLTEPLVLEFPEMTSSTRRDHWLALIKEVILLHCFVSRFNTDSPMQAWELHARTILGIVRLHAAREMLRIAPPAPTNFLIFSLYDELPKGDYVLEELANNLKGINSANPRSGASILKSLSISPSVPGMEMKDGYEEHPISPQDSLASLETTIDQVREEAKEVSIAKATVEEMKEEGISDSLLILTELLSPVKNVLPFFQEIMSWERPAITVIVLALTLVIIYKEWVGYAISTFLMWGVGMMLWARWKRLGEKCQEVVICTSSDKTTVESIVAAQHSLQSLQELIKKANITVLKIWSIFISRASKHADHVMWTMSALAGILIAVPFKYMLMGLTLYVFTASLMAKKSTMPSDQHENRRLKEWWDSIPIISVRIVDSSS